MRKSRWSVVSMLTLFLAASLIAQEKKDFSDINLESLLEVKTVTAAKTEQTVQDAPAVMSVLTAKQIRDLGVQNLYEALQTLAGVVVTESYFGYSMVNIRGVLQSHYNNKVLLLINGHPLYEGVNGSFHLEMIPLDIIKRVEVIRGPGSALYGTNAFAGVINIITRKTGRDAAVEGGSFSTYDAQATFSVGEEKRGLILSAGSRGDDGYDYNVTADERGNSGTLSYENDYSNFFFQGRYDEFTLSGGYFQQRKAKFGITPVLDYTGINDFSGGFFDALWDHPLSDVLSIRGRLRYDAMDREMDIGHFPYDGFADHPDADSYMTNSGDQLAGEWTFDYHPNDTLSLLTGLIYEYAESDPYRFVFKDDNSTHPFSAYLESHENDETGIFGQLYWKPTSRTSIVAGFRASDNDDSGSSFAPRAGVIFRVTDKSVLKLLYGEAYRNPNFFEKYVTTYNVLFGSKDLNAEKIRNVDLVFDSTFTRHSVRIDLFHLETDDIITRVPTDNSDLTGPKASMYVNGEGDRIWGGEVELHGSLLPSLGYYLSYAYLDAERRNGGADITAVPEHSGSLGFSWKVCPHLYLHPSVTALSSQGDIGGYALYNLNVTIPLNDRFTLSVIGRNLGDKEYEYPEYIRNISPGIPGGPGRAVYGRLRVKF